MPDDLTGYQSPGNPLSNQFIILQCIFQPNICRLTAYIHSIFIYLPTNWQMVDINIVFISGSALIQSDSNITTAETQQGLLKLGLTCKLQNYDH